MALRADDVEAAGVERLLLEHRNLIADPDFRSVTLRPRIKAVDLHLDAHVGIAAKLDVGTASGHVGGDRDRSGNAGLADDERLLLVIAGIEDRKHLLRGGALVAVIERGEGVRVGEVALLIALLLEEIGELLRLLDRGGADEERLALAAALVDKADDRLVLLLDRS